jgi:hypothetical protein
VLILDLLKFASAPHASHKADTVARALAASSERELRWSLDAGLGPLLHYAIADRREFVSEARRNILRGADLAAQVKHGDKVDAATEVIEVCNRIGAPVTLLKGISVSAQHYPAGHLRPMTDVDLLISADCYPAIETELLLRGYQRSRFAQPPDAHHGTPLRAPASQAWIELHTALFPESSGLTRARVFSAQRIAEQSIETTFHGASVRHLSPELQVAYLASSWIFDLTLGKIDPSFVIALVDAVYLLDATGRTLDWDAVLQSLDNELAHASVCVLLSYLARHRLATIPILAGLMSSEALVGRLELRAMHAMLDYCLLGGHRWSFVLPPPVPGRYNLRSQLRKRRAR